MKLLVSVTVFGKASEYIKDDIIPVPDANTVRSPNDRTESNDKIFKPSWSFEPLNSVQDIYGGFNSNTKLFTGR